MKNPYRNIIHKAENIFFEADAKLIPKPLEAITDEIQEIHTVVNYENLDMKILIAEDNLINMMLLKTILKDLFPKAVLIESENGEEAIEKFIEAAPDLILMDVHMPLKNGYEATEKIRSLPQNPTIPIIALTAGTLKEDRAYCLASGMNDYLSKPIVKDVIKEVILKWQKIV